MQWAGHHQYSGGLGAALPAAACAPPATCRRQYPVVAGGLCASGKGL